MVKKQSRMGNVQIRIVGRRGWKGNWSMTKCDCGSCAKRKEKEKITHMLGCWRYRDDMQASMLWAKAGPVVPLH